METPLPPAGSPAAATGDSSAASPATAPLGPNGDIFVLRAGSYEAHITSVGAAVQVLRHDGRNLVVPYGPDEVAPSFAGKTLVPWPNRIADGRYAFAGTEFELPVNDRATGTALHGLLVWEAWAPLEIGASSVTLLGSLHGQPGYPFQLRVQARFDLDAARGLQITVTAVNCGASPAPYGVSSHPYLTVDGAPVDECELTVDAGTVLMVDENLLPVGRKAVAGTRFDFSEPVLMGSASLDHAFTDLPDGPWEVSLRHPGTGAETVLAATGGSGQSTWLQIYSGEKLDRKGMAVEPMTCPPDAFNSGTDLIVLDPEGSHTFEYRIYARG